MSISLARSAVLLLCAATPLAAQNVAITGATVIDGTGKAPIADGVVVITNGRISAFGKAGTVQVPASTRTIDARGKYVIPGLMDANLHLFLNGDVETLIKSKGATTRWRSRGRRSRSRAGRRRSSTPGDRASADQGARHDRRRARRRAAGSTSPATSSASTARWRRLSRRLGGAYVSKAFAKRHQRARGNMGRDASCSGCYPTVGARQRSGSTPRAGVDFLKYGASGHVDMNFIAVLRARAEGDRRGRASGGKTVQAHVTSPESVDMAVEAGVDILTHGDISGPNHTISAGDHSKMIEREGHRGVGARGDVAPQRRVSRSTSPDGVLTPFYEDRRTINIRNMMKDGVRTHGVDRRRHCRIRCCVASHRTIGVGYDRRAREARRRVTSTRSYALEEARDGSAWKSSRRRRATWRTRTKSIATWDRSSVGKVGDVVILDARSAAERAQLSADQHGHQGRQGG